MKCPWKLNVPAQVRVDDECDPDCAWLLEVGAIRHSNRACAVALLASSGMQSLKLFPVNVVEREHDE